MIVVLGFSSGRQRSLIMRQKEMQIGEVNRFEQVIEYVGGKALHTALAASKFHETVLVTPSGDGMNSRFMEDILRSRHPNCHSRFICDSGKDVRICTTILEEAEGGGHRMTELVEPSPAWSDSCLTSTLETVRNEMAKKECKGLAICGSWPSTVDASLFSRLAVDYGCDLLVDGLNVLPETSILKVNGDELLKIAGLSKDSSLDSAAAKVMEKYPRLRVVGVTMGGDGGVLWERGGEGKEHVRRSYIGPEELPKIQVKNPIGAGDTVSGVMFALLAMGVTAQEAFKKGLRAASKSCESYYGADFDPQNFAS
uniref:Carbohydrate kinase PfkB domain-containing protein n=1 Tax=Chromera velia CCMP2878 TaxID=1169474 RepID=A0A0G4GIZ3_9ALVE|eukprot:Cvel_22074.t1-p1 / transcript=Cvel_22074.t1 / gene=Cvel_22074 / organism=Chromera_velia_CCMP2878 / gene_product=Tagatose-6-phosphate kinase, putative / transcript_product=Tagatose-6-phosphate kinase, putative / location=Cvel_scaffold2133:20211-21140(-) / protein_length=310 / sequence_SO=supercontig / SO=protein_coding / is_pseudo=false